MHYYRNSKYELLSNNIFDKIIDILEEKCMTLIIQEIQNITLYQLTQL